MYDLQNTFLVLFASFSFTSCCISLWIACKNSGFSLLLAAWDVLRGGMCATQRQKFHADDVNQCLHNKFSSHGVLNANMFNFMFLLVDFGSVVFICE